MADTPYLTPAAIRTRIRSLVDSDAYPDDVLSDLVAEFEEIAERYCGELFTTRTKTETFRVRYGYGYDPYPTNDLLGRVQLSWRNVQSVTTVTVDGVAKALTTDYVVDLPSGLVTFSPPVSGLVLITYTAGLTSPPYGILRACRLYVRACALRDVSELGRDVIRQGFEGGGTTQYSTPDWEKGRPTGYMDVDRLLNAHVFDPSPVGIG